MNLHLELPVVLTNNSTVMQITPLTRPFSDADCTTINTNVMSPIQSLKYKTLLTKEIGVCQLSRSILNQVKIRVFCYCCIM